MFNFSFRPKADCFRLQIYDYFCKTKGSDAQKCRGKMEKVEKNASDLIFPHNTEASRTLE